MARPSHFKLGWRNCGHPSPGGMIYRGLKTSQKSASDKLSGKRTFFSFPGDFTVKAIIKETTSLADHVCPKIVPPLCCSLHRVHKFAFIWP